MEPIVRVCTRTRRITTLSAGLAAWFLGLNAAVVPFVPASAVFSQDEGGSPAAEDDGPTVPAERLAIDESKYDPPLSDPDKVKQWVQANGESKFTQALRQDPPSAADRDVLTGAIKHYLYQMTVKEERDNLHLIVQRVVERVNSPRLTTAAARSYANEEIVRIARELLHQPPPVRLNALILAASLVSDPTAEPAKPYVGASPLFVDVLGDPNQLIDSKIWAVKGLARICQAADVPISERDKAATNLVDALNAPDATNPANWVYRLRIVDALGDTGLAYSLQRQPIVIDALVGVLANRKESWIIRSTAARSVTRIPWLAADNVNVPLIVYHVSQLAKDMASARNTNLKWPHWKYCFINIYLSFKPYNSAERDKKLGLTEQVTRPHLASSKALVDTAYAAVIPVVNSVTSTPMLSPRATTAAEMKSLDDWLKDHVPDDRKPTPASQAVDQTEQRTAPMADNTRP